MTEVRQLILTGVDGTVWDLTNHATSIGVRARPDQVVWGAPPAMVDVTDTVNTPGARVVGAEYAPRDMLIPVQLRSSTPSELDELMHRLAVATDAVAGDVTVTVIRGDGTSRSIDARLMSGLSLIPLANHSSTKTEAPLVLRAHHPFFRSTDKPSASFAPPASSWDSDRSVGWNATDVGWNDVSTRWSANQPADNSIEWSSAETDWNDPEMPFNGGWTGLVRQTLPNDGDVESWPVWTVTGAASIVSAMRFDTGERWRLKTGLASGSKLTINSRTGAVRIDGELALPRLSERALWSVPKGGCEVVVRHSSRDSTSDISATYNVEFLTP